MHEEANRILTEVGPGRPAGEWLRRYWHPIAISDKWDGTKTLWHYDEPVQFRGRQGTVASWGEKLGDFTGRPTAVRILGEDLVLFRDLGGKLGLIGQRCPHRGASLEHGRLRDNGLACCYHGWHFDARGRCLAQPAEPDADRLKQKVRLPAYPLRELGGLIWTYMGPGDPPVLPQLDVVAREDGVRIIGNLGLWPANYLQICENSVDQTHTGILHASTDGERSDVYGEIPKPVWEFNEYGISSTQTRPKRNYQRTSQYVLPTINRLAEPWPGGRYDWPRHSAHFRTPVDDTHTLFFTVVFMPDVDGKRLDGPPEGMPLDTTDSLHGHRIQDYIAIVSQGPITLRDREFLGAGDGGVVRLRRLITESIEAVERGEDPHAARRSADRDGIIDLSEIVVDNSMRSMPKPAAVPLTVSQISNQGNC